MGDINRIAEQYPEVADFRANDLIALRGDVLSYWANLQNPSLSTDAQGFRHSTFGGKKYSVVECTRSPRYGLTFGPSTFFGSGIAGNENTLASRLAERFGFPFGNAAMPGANSRNISALLLGLVAMAKRPPAVVVLSNGGDIANFCEAGSVDPVFGSPNHLQIKTRRPNETRPDLETEFGKLLVFTKFWTIATFNLCRARGIPVVFVHQSTFFEKTEPSAIERHNRLGEALRPSQVELFANFRTFGKRFFAHRQNIAKQLGMPLPGVGLTNRFNFIDEFHIDADGVKLLSDAIGDAIEPLIGAGA